MIRTPHVLALAAGLLLITASADAQDRDWRARAVAAFESGEPVRQREIIEAAARAGDAEAQMRLGDMLRRGEGTVQDLEAAALWYGRAADQAYAPAQNALGRLSFDAARSGSERNRALALLSAAAAQGAPDHGHDYALALESDGQLEEAARWYEQLAEAGHPPALTSLGVLALEGRGVDVDLARAFALFEAAADAGDARAQNNLGLMYARGTAADQDYARAAALFQAAAEAGLAPAMGNLAVLYENGFGVAVDEEAAIRLYRQAARSDATGLDQMVEALGAPWPDRLAPFDPSRPALARDAAAAAAGDPVARFAMAHRFAVGAGRPTDYREAARLYRVSAGQGFAPAALSLGLLYVRGLGVPQDYVQAHGWLVRAAAAGEPGAAALRDALYGRMSADQRAQAAARSETVSQD